MRLGASIGVKGFFFVIRAVNRDLAPKEVAQIFWTHVISVNIICGNKNLPHEQTSFF